MRASSASQAEGRFPWPCTPLLTPRGLVVALSLGALLLLLALWLRGAAGMALVALVATLLVLAGLCAWRKQARISLLGAHVEEVGQDLVYAAMAQSPDSMAVVAVDGRLLYANQAFLARTGYTLEEIQGSRSREISTTGMSPEQYAQMRATVERGDVWRSLLTNHSKDGAEVKEGVHISPIKDSEGRIMGFVELKHDVTELLDARERVDQLLHFDALTLLPNRQALSQYLEELLQPAPSYPMKPTYWHALVLLDMDNLSKFNAGRGIEWGDALLRAVAHKMQSLLPPTAWLARTTGDEFALVLKDVAQSRLDARMMAFALATELQRGLSTQVVFSQGIERVQVTFCVGITVFPFGEPARKRDTEDHIYRRATMALYQAKALGPGQLHTFSESLEVSSERKLSVERGLYEALARQHLRMYVQKQVDIDGQVRGVEALIRWEHPEEGMVSPGMFIPVAEESELIVQLGDWMLKQALALLSHPLVAPTSMWVAVNISARQFAQPDFVDKLAQLLQGVNLAPGRLTLEVTESMVLTSVEDAIQTMTRLNALGVQCALDDFGTGYSSLAYLHRLPIQEIKIDQSFIHNLDPEAKSGALVQALLMVAKSMQLRVVAEGVEESDQAAVLQAWYPAILCQGFLYSRPIPVEDWLQELSDQALTPP